MTLYNCKERFQGFSVKIGNFFSRFGLSPNQWTFVSLIPALFGLYYLIAENFVVAALFFIFSFFVDMIDGSVARATGKVSKRGAYLDTIVDRYIEGMVVFGLLFITIPSVLIPVRAWIFLYFFGSMMTTYVKAAAKEKGLIKNELRGGILERADRLLLLFAGIMLASFDRIYLSYIIIILAGLTNISVLQRIKIAMKGGKDATQKA